MAINLNVSENQVQVPLRVSGGGTTRTISPDDGNPYYVGARAYVTQTESGAVITIIDKDGTTTATVLNGDDGNGIASIVMNDDYTLTILMDDGTSVTTDSIRGEKGEKGDDAEVESITNAELEEILV